MAQESLNSNTESNSLPAEKDTERKDKKKSAKRSKFAAPLPISLSEGKPTPERPKPSAFDMALAEYALKNKKEKKQPLEPGSEVKKPSEPKAEPLSETEAAKTEAEVFSPATEAEPRTSEEPEPASKDLAERFEDKFETDESKAISAHELPSNKVSMGEGVIDLGHIDEQVVLLRAEQSVFQAQPEQQHQATAEAGSEEPQERDVSPESSPKPLTNTNETAEAAQETAAASTPQAESVPTEDATEHLRAEPEAATHSPEVAMPGVEQTPVPDQPPVPDYQYAYRQQQHFNQAPPRPVASTAENVATKQDVEDAIYYATKAGQRNGVIAGAAVIGGYEHFKHRRREKKLEKAAKNQAKLLEKERETHKWQLQEQARQQQAHGEKGVLPALEHEMVASVPPTMSVEAQAAISSHNRTQYPNSQHFFERRFTEPIAAVVTEQLAAARSPQPERFEKPKLSPERKFKSKLEKLLPKKPEKITRLPEDQTMERLAVPEGHRLEASAWHTIEIDSKTGKPVENPTFAYGQEYYRERSRESAPRDDKRDAAAGEVALVAAAMQAAGEPSSTMPPAVAPAVPPVPKQKAAAKLSDKASQILQATSDSAGPIWPWLVAFIVIIILIVVFS